MSLYFGLIGRQSNTLKGIGSLNGISENKDLSIVRSIGDGKIVTILDS
jgi:hypothetical protein